MGVGLGDTLTSPLHVFHAGRVQRSPHGPGELSSGSRELWSPGPAPPVFRASAPDTAPTGLSRGAASLHPILLTAVAPVPSRTTNSLQMGEGVTSPGVQPRTQARREGQSTSNLATTKN